MAIPPAQESGYQLWWYYPSLPGNVVFAALFLILSITHLVGLVINRLKFCLPLLVGGVFEVVGYGARAYAHYHPGTVTIYATQSLLILLAPILFAASVYMYLGRLMIATNTTELSPIPIRFLTRVFVAGDVFCFCVQAAGGGMLSVAKLHSKMYLGEDVILAGLCAQILFFGLFVAVVVVVHARMMRTQVEESTVAWQRSLAALYLVSSLICVRNVYRAVEHGLGSDGYLLTHEWAGFVFDGALMAIVLVICLSWYVGGGVKPSLHSHAYANPVELKRVQATSLSV